MKNNQRTFCLISTYELCLNSSYLDKQIRDFFTLNHIAQPIRSPHHADVIIINTCSFIDKTEQESLQVMAHHIEKYPDKKIILCGCLPKLELSLRRSNVTIIKANEMERFNEIFQPEIKIQDIPVGEILHRKNDLNYVNQGDYFIEISKGCAFQCSYCAIKQAKGLVKSRSIEAIIAEVRTALADGYKKFTLLADDCGSYGLDISSSIADLCNALDDVTDAEILFNLHYFFPAAFLKNFHRINPSFFKKVYYINVPLQSLSSTALKHMQRNYSVSAVLESLKKLKKWSPDCFLGTHLMFGFPGETMTEFMQTIKLRNLFNEVEYFFYSPRKDTKAAQTLMPQPLSTLLRRALWIKAWMAQYEEITLDVYGNIFLDILNDYEKNKHLPDCDFNTIIIQDQHAHQTIPLESMVWANQKKKVDPFKVAFFDLEQHVEEDIHSLIKKHSPDQIFIIYTDRLRKTDMNALAMSIKDQNNAVKKPKINFRKPQTTLSFIQKLWLKFHRQFPPFFLMIPKLTYYEETLRKAGELDKITLKNHIPATFEDYVVRLCL